MKPASGFSPRWGLIAALFVMVAGIVTALTYDDGRAANDSAIDTVPTTSSPPPSSLATGSGATATTPSSTITTSAPTTTASSTTTTVRPAVPSPEAAANGLWAAYTTADREAAARFATSAVIDALFSSPYSGEEGNFESCHKRSPGVFDCRYAQPSVEYTMTAVSDATGSFQITEISSTGTTTTTTASADFAQRVSIGGEGARYGARHG